MSPRVAQGTPRGADGHQKSARRGPREVRKGRKIRKKRKLRHLDFERPYGGFATFTHFGEARVQKKGNKISTKKKKSINTQNHTKNATKTIQNQFCSEKSEKRIDRGVPTKLESRGRSMPGPLNSSHHSFFLGSLGLRRMSSDTPART